MQKRAERISLLEVFLPLIFFSDEKVFYASLLIPLVAGFSLLLHESFRFLPGFALTTIYRLGLALCGGASWYAADIPPYWIWSVVLLIPERLWNPTEIVRKRPFLFGLKKYFKRRTTELMSALLVALAFSGSLFLIKQKIQGLMVWPLTLLVLIFCEVVFNFIRDRKK